MGNIHANFKIFKSNKGSSVIIFAITLTVITGIAALSVDYGVIVLQKAILSAAVDSAALAGAQELAANSGNAKDTAQSYVLKNQANVKETEITIDPDNRGIEVNATQTVENYFAKTFNKKNQDISAVAKAKIENIKSLSGARPLAVVQQTFDYGKLYTLKEGGGDGTTGNYAALALGGAGASNYGSNLLNGYSGTISVGDVIDTETGNMAGTTQSSINQLMQQCDHNPPCTYESYNIKCPRVIFIPVVNTLTVNGKKCVKVLGFATFFLEGVTSYGGQADVTGRFITYSMQGATASDIGDFGTYGIRLVK